jgi:hypothetical protein
MPVNTGRDDTSGESARSGAAASSLGGHSIGLRIDWKPWLHPEDVTKLEERFP